MAATTTRTLTIFNYCGKNYIGYYCVIGDNEANKPNFVGIGNGGNTSCYVFQAPAEITYEVSVTSDATADLVSKRMYISPSRKRVLCFQRCKEQLSMIQ